MGYLLLENYILDWCKMWRLSEALGLRPLKPKKVEEGERSAFLLTCLWVHGGLEDWICVTILYLIVISLWYIFLVHSASVGMLKINTTRNTMLLITVFHSVVIATTFGVNCNLKRLH